MTSGWTGERPTVADGGRPGTSRVTARRAELLGRVLDAGELGFAELAEVLGVSEMTVRRDARLLEREGRLRLVHGGVMATPEAPGGHRRPSFVEPDRAATALAIARAAERLIGVGEAVAMCTGTEALAGLLAGRDDLTVVSSSLSVITELAATPGPTVITTGGRVDAARLGLVGDLAESAFGRVNCDLAVIGAGGIATAAPPVLTSASESEARLIRAAMRSARRVAVLADRAALGRTGLYGVTPMTSVDVLVTDAPPDDPVLGAIRAAGTEVVVVDPPAEMEVL